MRRASSAGGAVIGRPVLVRKRDHDRSNNLRQSAPGDRSITRTRILAGLAIIALAGSLSGCREREQGRPLRFEPGVFQGEKAPSLTEDQRKRLNERGYLMR
jgi:hypothetical protein